MNIDFEYLGFYCNPLEVEKNVDGVIDTGSFSDDSNIDEGVIQHIKEKYNIEDCYTAYILWSSLSDTVNGKIEFVASKIPFFKKDNRLYAPIQVGQEWYLFEEYMYSNPDICKEVLSDDTIKIFDNLNTCDLYECTSLFFVKDGEVEIDDIVSRLRKSFVQVILYRLGFIGTLIEEELKN